MEVRPYCRPQLSLLGVEASSCLACSSSFPGFSFLFSKLQPDESVNLQQEYHFSCGLATAARWQAWSQGSRDQYGYQRLINVDSSYLCSSPVHFYFVFHWAWPMHDLRFSTTDRRKSQARPTSSHKWVWSNCCNKTLLYSMAAGSAFLSESWLVGRAREYFLIMPRNEFLWLDQFKFYAHPSASH